MTDDNSVRAVLANDFDLAEAMFKALTDKASLASEPAIMQDRELRDVLLDGHFDFVTAARILREALHKELLRLPK